MTKLDSVVQILKSEQDRLTRELQGIGAALAAFGSAYGKQIRHGNGMSAAGKARIAAAQRARWAKVKAKNGKPKVAAMPKRRRLSVAARRKIAAAQRARWAKVKATKKSAKA